MKKYMNFIRHVWIDEEGQGTVEYALILACIMLEVVFIIGSVGTDLDGKFIELDGLIF